MVLSPSSAAVEDRLVRDNLFLVRSAVADLSKRMPRYAARDDLRSAGLVGLAQAARSFDPARGVPFHRYAATRIKGALLDELRAQDWASRPVRSKAREHDRAREALTASLGRTPTDAELADAMGVATSVVTGISRDVHRAVVVDFESVMGAGVGEGESVLLAVHTDPESEILQRERAAYLVDAVRALPERLRIIIIGYFFEDRSMQEMGDQLGVSESRVSQLRAEALDLLRDGMNSQLDPSLLPDRPGTGRVARRLGAYFAAISASSTPRERVGSQPRLRPPAAAVVA